MLAATLRLSPVRRPAGSGPPRRCGARISMLGQPLDPVRPQSWPQRNGRRGQPGAGEHHRTGVGEGGSARVRPGRHRRRGGAADPVRDRVRAERPADGWPSRWSTRSTPTAACRTTELQAGPPVLPPPADHGRRLRRGVPAHRGPAGETAGAARTAGQAAGHHRRRPRTGSRSSSRSAAPRAADARRVGRRVRPAAPARQPGPRRRRHPGHRDHHHRPGRPARQHRLRRRHRRHPDPHRTVRELADQADIYIAAILTSNGEPLRLGRTRRIASRSQTIALIARDVGCSFPGCDTAPEWCRTAPHHALGRRRHHRSGQSDAALRLPPPQLPRQRLGLRHQRRRTPRMVDHPGGSTDTDDP